MDSPKSSHPRRLIGNSTLRLFLKRLKENLNKVYKIVVWLGPRDVLSMSQRAKYCCCKVHHRAFLTSVAITFQIGEQTTDKKFENEIKQEQERKKKEAEEAKQRREAFKLKAATFQ